MQSISETFIERIKNHSHPLFYNSKGSTRAYKLGIRHLSAAPLAGLATRQGNSIYPKEIIYLVDLDKQSIKAISNKIKLINIETIK